MNKDKFKKTLIRFLKEKNIYSFIINEINKEYKHSFSEFINNIERKKQPNGVFNLISILSFDWYNIEDSITEQEKDTKFWRAINNEWMKICENNDYFNII